jgi:hypothetical protein
LTAVDNTLSTVNSNADLILASNGTGNVELVGNIHFHTTTSPTSTPFFTADGDGQITILVPATDPQEGAFKIIGSATGKFTPPLNTGVMLQVTGNNDDASRIYNDAIGGFAAFVGRRTNGNLTVPTAVQAGNELIRISATGYDGNSLPGAGQSRIVFQAIENFTTTARGANLSIWTTATGTNVLVKTATFDRATGLSVSGNVSASAYRVASAGIRTIQADIYANLSFATDTIVHQYNPSGDVAVNLNNYTAGATITLIISMDTRRAINYGVTAARNSTTGATSIPSNSLLSPQSVQLVYTCIDGTAANTYVAVSRV